LFHYHIVHYNTAWTQLGLNLGLCSDKATTNYVSCGAAIML